MGICRLLTTAAGLETFLSTVNYSISILAYFEKRSPSHLAFLERLNQITGLPLGRSKNSASPSRSSQSRPKLPTPFQNFETLISGTRTALRLIALLPLYTWLRELLVDKDKQDTYLRAISVTQCLSYMIYQFLENVAFLSDRGVVSQRWLAKRGGSTKWWLWSCRAWLAGILCDFLILFRKALIEQQRRNKAKDARTEAEDDSQSFDRRWWSDLFVASCWLPVSLHYSLQDGLKAMNTGTLGLLGFMAGMQNIASQWAGTERET